MVLLIWGVLRPLCGEEAVPQDTPGNPQVLTLSKEQAHGSLAVVFEKDRTLSLDELQKAQAPTSIHGVRLSASDRDGSISIQAAETDVTVKADGFAGWSATLARGSSTAIQIASKQKCLNVTTPLESSQRVVLHLPDGGRVQMDAGANVRFDSFADQSYCLSGQGSVRAISADGKESILNPSLPPLTGGPLALVSDGPGNSHWERRVPTLPVTVCGELGGELTVNIGSRVIPLTEGEPEEVSLPNGSLVRFERNRLMHDLRWYVDKGDLRLSVQGIAGWKAVGASGQSAGMVWDQRSQSVDLRNLSPNNVILVALPNQTFARVEANATFQFMQVTPDLFATSASGGRVTLLNALTQEKSDLGRGNLFFKFGAAMDAARVAPARSTVLLAWLNNSKLEVSYPAGRMQLEPKEDRILPGPDGSQLEVHFRQGGEVSCRSLNGDYTICPTLLDRTAIELRESTGVLLGMSQQHGALVASAFPGNPASVEMVVANRLTSSLNPGESVTLLAPALGQARPVSPTVIFSETFSFNSRRTSGTSPLDVLPTTSADSWSFGRDNNHLYDSRISQPPVTVVR